MAEPLVSIVIPTYKPTFLEAAIESALAQTYRSTEILVSDQCPDDSVRQIVQRYPQIRYQRNPVPGVYANFRNCIRIANGKLVKFLLDDDLIEPHCVSSLVQVFRDYRYVTLASGRYNLIDETGREIAMRGLDIDRPLISSPGGGAPHILVSARNPVGPLTTCLFLRRALPLGMGPFFFHTGAPQQYFGLIDMTIILDLAFQGRVVALPDRLSSMRMHAEQLSNKAQNPRLVYTVRSWLPLADDAHAFGLLSDAQHRQALDTVLAQFRRFIKTFPELAADIATLEARMARPA